MVMNEVAKDPWLEKPTAEVEEWLLNELGKQPPDWGMIRTVLEQRGRVPDLRAEARSWAELVLERMKREEACAEGLALVEIMAGWEEDEKLSGVAERARERLADLFSLKVGGRLFLEAASSQGVSLSETVRRLRLLLDLKEGRFCFHRGLGGGIIRRVDPFYGKVIVDFRDRPAHELSFAFAAESLMLPAEDHLMAIWHRDPSAIHSLALQRPDELVRLALRSEGAMTMGKLEGLLTPMVTPEPGWKAFWTAARKRLQERGDVLLPARKSEPVRLVSRVLTVGERWVERLRAERQPDRLVQILESMSEEKERPEGGGEWQVVAREKLRSILTAAAGNPEWAARAFLAAEALGLSLEGDEEVWRSRWRQTETLIRTLNALPVRRLAAFLRFLHRVDSELIGRVLSAVSSFHFSVLGELLDVLLKEGWETEVRNLLSAMARERRETIRLLAWMAKQPERVARWSLMPLEELPFRIVEALRSPSTGEDLKAANVLRSCLLDREWIQQVFDGMDSVRRADFIRLALHPEAPRYFDSQLLLSRLVALFPELASHFTAGESSQEEPVVTSWRTYRKRQAQLEKLIREEIPRNAKEIERARSYGDLRENHEYKTAKEMQSLLLRRQQEWQRDLQAVKPTDFSGFPNDRVGVGTEVELELDGGGREVYRILGEWDFDAELGVISSKSGLAEILRGRREGEVVEVPREDGRRTKARVVAVRPLPPEVVAWATSIESP